MLEVINKPSFNVGLHAGEMEHRLGVISKVSMKFPVV